MPTAFSENTTSENANVSQRTNRPPSDQAPRNITVVLVVVAVSVVIIISLFMGIIALFICVMRFRAARRKARLELINHNRNETIGLSNTSKQ